MRLDASWGEIRLSRNHKRVEIVLDYESFEGAAIDYAKLNDAFDSGEVNIYFKLKKEEKK